MLIEALRAYAEKNLAEQLADPAFETKPVRFLLRLGTTGEFLGIITTVGDSESKFDKGKRYQVPTIGKRTSGVKPNFLADKRSYVIGGPTTKDKKTAAAFTDLVVQAADETQDATLGTVAAFCRSETERARAAEGLDAAGEPKATGSVISFVVEPEMSLPVFSSSAAIGWWTKWSATGSERTEDSGGRSMVCLGCGRVSFVALSHPIPIKGIPQAHTAGAALVSVNNEAFESFGWTRAHNSPVCLRCSQAYAMALNSLLANRRTSIRVGSFKEASIVVLVWADDGPTSILDLFDAADPETLRSFISAPWTGTRPETEADDRLHVVALSATGPRIVVRAWLDEPLRDGYQRLVKWFDDLGLRAWRDVYWPRDKEPVTRVGDEEPVTRAGDKALPPRLRDISAALVRDPAKSAPPPWVGPVLLRAALFGERVPSSLLSIALDRFANVVHNDGVNGGRTAIALAQVIRLCLNRSQSPMETTMPADLDTTINDPGYLCGRLLAHLTEIQYTVNRNLNATIVDRFYGRASKAPASVYPHLLGLAQTHLSTLRRGGRGGAAYRLEGELNEMLVAFPGASFPTTLTLQGQGRFAIGFASQKALKARQRLEASSVLAATPDDADEEDNESLPEAA